jgi:quinol monooxygenase YgiN
MIVIDAAVEANDDSAFQKLVPLISAAVRETQKEKGCVKYQWSIDIDNPPERIVGERSGFVRPF